MTSDPTHESDGLEVRSYFVRGRNALLARADFGELYVDYYLHQGQHGYQHAPAHDGMLKEALAALTLHCASRPWNESCAWTIHFHGAAAESFRHRRQPSRHRRRAAFHRECEGRRAQPFRRRCRARAGEPRRSAVEFEGTDLFRAVEQYYAQSEQRPARFFRYGPEDFVHDLRAAAIATSRGWRRSTTQRSARSIRPRTLSLLEHARYRWECGCSQERMLAVLAPIMRRDPEGLFGEEAVLRMSCPRCGARHTITREALEAYVARRHRRSDRVRTRISCAALRRDRPALRRAGLERLRAAHVCVIGVGGVGSWIVEALARSGVGALTMIDLDDVCVTNVNRQLPALDGQIGRPKVDVLAERVRADQSGVPGGARSPSFSPQRAPRGCSSRVTISSSMPSTSSRNKCLIITGARARVAGAHGRRRGRKARRTAVRVADLAEATQDELLRQVRRKLRRDYGFPRGHKDHFGVRCAYSPEKPVYPWSDGTACAEPEPGSDQTLDCARGFGTATFVTGAFGFAAAGEVARLIALRGD